MKNDIQLNFDQLDYISKSLTVYLGSVSRVKKAAQDFYQVISEQKSDDLRSRMAEWMDFVIEKAEKLSDYVTRNYRMLEKYIRTMQSIISPTDSSKMMRVDKSDIERNLEDVKNCFKKIENSFLPVPISLQDYKLDLLGDLLSEESLNASIEKQQKEQQYRMDNYWKIANTRNILFYRIESYVAKELLSVYNNYVTPYVEMDQELAEEAESFYEEFKGVADYVRESVHTGENTVRGFRDAAVGMVDGLYTLALVCTPEVQEMYWAGELDAEMEQRIEGFYDVSTLMVTDPGEFVDVVGQSIADTYETEGMAYMVGGGLFELALGKGVTKVIEKIGDLADIGKTAKVAKLLDEGGTSTINGSDLVFGSSTKSTQKLMNQMNSRGWTEDLIRNTVDNPYTTRTSVNKATGNSATVFYTQQGSYVIVDDVTKAIVQISDNINPSTWAPDLSIVDPYIPD